MTSAWVESQILRIKSLTGQKVEAWVIEELALNSNKIKSPIWYDSSVPVLQATIVEFLRAGERCQIDTYQDDEQFGLCLAEQAVPSIEMTSENSGPVRIQSLDRFPVGIVADVVVLTNTRGNIARVNLQIDHHELTFVAGEIALLDDNTFEVREMDGSILLQLDGKRPAV